MGNFSQAVQSRLKEQLAESQPRFSWDAEHQIAGIRIDIAGISKKQLILIELEWRRADPADNTAKLFRHLSSGEISADHILVFQLFTRHYDLARGGVSSKRKNAEFVGETAASALDQLTYIPLEFDLNPPKEGEPRSAEWKKMADSMIEDISAKI